MVYDDADNTDNYGGALIPFAWSNPGISVSEMSKGLGVVGLFLQFTGCAQATFDPTTGALTQLQVNDNGEGYLCPVAGVSGSVYVKTARRASRWCAPRATTRFPFILPTK
jgi:hypothetical protein